MRAAQNAVLSVPDPNACIMRKCAVFPVEFVVRGFMTGEPRPPGAEYQSVRWRVWCEGCMACALFIMYLGVRCIFLLWIAHWGP